VARELSVRIIDMRIAIPDWQGRISPVFDAAKKVLLVDVEGDRQVGRSEHRLAHLDPLLRAKEVAELGADMVICGAVSWPLEMALRSAGVGLIAQTCGPVEDVLDAFLSGQLTDEAYLMPGCCGRRRRFRGRHGHGWRQRSFGRA